ncbi:MAG: DUF1501 domain-containing protein [Acidimicrobiales bacterium]
MHLTGPDLDTTRSLRLLHRDEPATPLTMSRRHFLAAAGAIGAAAALEHSVPAWAQEAIAAQLNPLGVNDGVLVIIVMGGGNDGLNMVVPYGEGRYYDLRGDTAITPADVAALDGRLGLHPGLPTVRSLYERGEVAIVQGVGSANPDLSHFVSMANWMRGWGGAGTPGSGWIGRWLDATAAGSFTAIELGTSIPLHLSGVSRKASAVGVDKPFGTDSGAVWSNLYNHISAYRSHPAGLGPWGDVVAAAHADQLTLAATAGPLYDAPLPEGRLSANLTLAARLINANLGARVLSTTFGDFDSHNGHRAMHDARMAELDAAIAAFYATLHPAYAGRVTIMTMSEFGRRARSNGNAGIDHGTAGTHLVIGPQVRGGVHGTAPSLWNLAQGDYLQATVHYLEYYASVLAQWLGADAAALLGTNPNQLALFSAGPGDAVPAPPPGATAPGELVATTPNRRLDTRIGQGVPSPGPLGAGQAVDVLVAGTGDVPASGTLAAVMNVTAVVPSSGGYLTVWPTGEERPYASSLNFQPGDVVPNLVVCKVGRKGMVSVYNAAGQTDVVADVVGYIRQATDTALIPTQPVRLLDTRDGAGPVGAGGEVALTVVGGAIPGGGVGSVVLNVTATGATADTFLTVYPDGQGRPWSSNLNVRAGQTVPNLVVAKVGDGGRVRIFNAAGTTHVVVDLLGYTVAAGGAGGRVVAVSPARVLDTREAVHGGPVHGGVIRRVQLAGLGGLPGGCSGVVANVTVTGPTADGYLTVWPAHLARPLASNLNFGPGQTVPNLVVAAVSPEGAVNLFAPFGSCHVIIDVVGYIT